MTDVRPTLIPPTSSALDALRVIDSSAQIALVVDDNNRLLGTLTDGDIRRALLDGETLDVSAEKLMNRDFSFVYEYEDKVSILDKMRRESIRHIPVLDKYGSVVELLLLQELLTPVDLENPVVIMAGGKGTRLRPHTENCPKPMIHVDGRPMLEILLEQCISSGFKKFYLSVNYLKEQIIDYFEDGSRWGVSISYLIEDRPLGTAGSLRLLPSEVDKAFLVLNGDVLTRLDPGHLLRFHSEHNSDATMCVREHVVTIPFGVVETNGTNLVNIQEKPTYRNLVNAGVYVIDPKVLKLLQPNTLTDMPSLLESAQKSGYNVSVCPIHEYWIDVGRPETLRKAHKEWPLLFRP